MTQLHTPEKDDGGAFGTEEVPPNKQKANDGRHLSFAATLLYVLKTHSLENTHPSAHIFSPFQVAIYTDVDVDNNGGESLQFTETVILIM